MLFSLEKLDPSALANNLLQGQKVVKYLQCVINMGKWKNIQLGNLVQPTIVNTKPPSSFFTRTIGLAKRLREGWPKGSVKAESHLGLKYPVPFHLPCFEEQKVCDVLAALQEGDFQC